MKLPNVLSHATQLNCCLFVFLVLLIAGCGGGGGGGTPVTTTVGFGNSLPPETGAGDVENFFPVVQGTSWNYLATVTNPTAGIPYSYMDSISVTGTKAVGGKVASVFLDSNPSGSGIPFEGYYYKTAGGVSFLGSSDTANEMATGIVPYIVSLFPVSPSVVADFQKNRLDFGSDLDGDGINERMDITLTSTINGFEPLTIGIGPFARTVKNTLAVSGSVVLSQSKTAIPFSSTSTRWSAPGIGIIKNIQGAIVQSITTSEIMELRGYTSNGVAHGFGMPVTVASNLPFNLLPLGGTPSLASSGQNFLAVTESASGLLGMLFDTQGGVISNLNLATVTGSVSPISAFDSTNYWVLYTPYSYGTSGSMDTCLAQRVSPAGALIDATAINLLTLGVGYSSITSKGFAFGNANGLLVYSTYNLSTWQHRRLGWITQL